MHVTARCAACCTANGMFYDPLSDRLLDYVGGQKDLKAGIIRSIGDPERRFKEDFLRLLRAVRFAARFDFSIDGPTLEAVETQCRAHVSGISAERIFAEYDRMLRQPVRDRGADAASP
ncbi:MAG: hypothetical protein MZV70_77365 [Desulfobacterales bacterium]|nr:hypothetical protein [Desulfobacterales bacterium]